MRFHMVLSPRSTVQPVFRIVKLLSGFVIRHRHHHHHHHIALSLMTAAPLRNPLTTSSVHNADDVAPRPASSSMRAAQVSPSRPRQPPSGLALSKCSVISRSTLLAETSASIRATCPKSEVLRRLRVNPAISRTNMSMSPANIRRGTLQAQSHA